MRRLYLLRHATAELGPGQDEEHLFSTVNSRLGERGEREARRVRDALAKVPATGVYASPTERSRHTAEIVAEPHELPVQVDERLLEVHVRPPGHDYHDILQAIVQIPALFEAQEDPALPNGERVSEVRARFSAALGEVMAKHETAIVVAHGLVNRVWLAPLLALPDRELLGIEQDHACVNVLDWGEEGPVVRGVNVVAGDVGRWS